MLDKSEKIFVAGHRGMVGSALIRRLESESFSNLLVRDRSKLDLRDESAVAKFFAEQRPDVVILAAAKVGGIKANIDFPVEFLAREFADTEQRHSFSLRERCAQTSLSWKLMHLPETRAATHPGNSVAKRTAGTNQ